MPKSPSFRLRPRKLRKRFGLKGSAGKPPNSRGRSRNNLEEDLNAKIGELEQRPRDDEGLLEKRDTQIAELQAKTDEAEVNASALKAQLENGETREPGDQAARKDLTAKLDKLQIKLRTPRASLEFANRKSMSLRPDPRR